MILKSAVSSSPGRNQATDNYPSIPIVGPQRILEKMAHIEDDDEDDDDEPIDEWG